MTDAHVGIRKHVQQKPADKFLGIYCHVFALVAVSAVSVPEGDKAIFDFCDTMIGDSDTMCVAAKVVLRKNWNEGKNV